MSEVGKDVRSQVMRPYLVCVECGVEGDDGEDVDDEAADAGDRDRPGQVPHRVLHTTVNQSKHGKGANFLIG